MKNITYLFGAGASCNALPLLNGMNIRMEYFRNYINENKDLFKDININKFLTTLNDIIDIIKDRSTVDVYARELFIQGTQESRFKLNMLKYVLSSYFIFEQAEKSADFNINSNDINFNIIPHEYEKIDKSHLIQIRSVIDKRYRTFWGEFLTDKIKSLPSNINILSWNYDMQFELSYSSLMATDIPNATNLLQVFPSKLKNIEFGKSKIIKLNGTAGQFYFNGNGGISYMFNKDDVFTSIKAMLSFFDSYQKNSSSYPIFSFAWENVESVINARRYASRILKETDILVIIGYSLPTYNRLVDQELFKEASSISKVYFQVPDFAVNDLKPTLSSIRSGFHKITEFVTDISKFYVPNEYFDSNF
jgi:hypothetical protein